jgi:hypothetical protein
VRSSLVSASANSQSVGVVAAPVFFHATCYGWA